MDAGPPPRADHRRKPSWLAIWTGLCAGGLLIAMAGPMLAGRVYTCDDLGCFHLPVRAFYAGQLARGEPFDWMPQLFCGFSLTGEGQAGSYHPLHWLLYRLLPLATAWPLECLASYPFMLAGTWLLLRRRLRRPEAAALGALLVTFSGFNLLHFVHPNAIAIVAHIPWLLWTIDVAMLDPDSRRRRAARIGVALLTGSQLLLGYPQYVWFSLLAEAAWGTLLLVGWPGREKGTVPICRNGPKGASHKWGLSPFPRVGSSSGLSAVTLVLLAAAKATGFLLGAVQLLPTIEALGLAARRSAGADFANLGALHPLNLVQLVSPYFFAQRSLGITPHEAGVYLGAVPLVLLVWLRTNATARQRLRGSGILVLLGLGALFLAFGPVGQLYRLQQLLPLVKNFRCPCRYLLLVNLALLPLAAAAFGELARQCSGRENAAWRELRPLAYVLGVATAVLLAGFALRGEPLLASRRLMVAGAALVASAVVLVSLAARGHRWALPGLVLLTAADLGLYGMTYAVYRDTYTLDEYVKLPLVPPGKPDVRMAADLLPFADGSARTGNQMLLAGWSRADGYAGLEPARSLNYQQLAALRLAGVGWVRRGAKTDAIAGLVVHDQNWLRVPDPLPHVRLETEKAKQTDSRPVVLSSRPGRLEIETQADGPCVLAVAESYHPGWQAAVDGQPAGVLRADGDFLGCRVEGGKHRICLEFRAESLRWGRLATLSAGVLVLLSCVTLVVQSQRRLV